MAKRNTYFENEVIERKIDIKQLGRVVKYVLPMKSILIPAAILMLITSSVSLITPKLLGYIVDKVVVGKDYQQLALVIAGIIAVAIIEIGLTFFHQRMMGKAGHGIIANIRTEIFNKLQELPFDYFDSRPDGKIVVRVTDYINDLANFFTNFVVLLIIYIVKIVVVSCIMISVSIPLTGVVFATVLPLMLCVFMLRYKIRKRFPEHRAKVSNRTAFMLETIMGEKIVKNYNRAEKNEEIYEDLNAQSINFWWHIVLLNELNTPIVEFFWNLGTVCMYGMALSMILSGNTVIGAGTVVTFTSYMALFNGPLTQIAMIIQNLAQVSSNLEQVFDTIDTPVQIENELNDIELKDVKGKVDFDNVTFSYEEGVNVLENFDLHVKPGETIALVGPTGAGKTTVINMLTRFYDVAIGEVKIDDINVKKANLTSLRQEVGVLMQDPFIFKGTIMDNIRYGRPDATDEECIKAAETIFADKCIKKMKDGYYQQLEERGEGLSAGEKQMISFARIILKDPSVIILDEATSSIDTETEHLIQQALEVVIKDKTAFIVAHRLSTIRNADRILYIDQKGIMEEGNHESLMKKKGYYYRLNMQIGM